jgi:hypothetical protein
VDVTDGTIISDARVPSMFAKKEQQLENNILIASSSTHV